MVVVKRVNKHATCSDQQNENLKNETKTKNLLLVKIDSCTFLLDCSPEPKLFLFQHTALALSTWISIVLNMTRFPTICF